MEGSRIRALSKDVINRIAAGEVIQRPCSAIKEMLENSIDAKSTKISVTLNNGGLDLIQIQDNGTGIVKDDMAIVCERFTTSKLSSFDDLKSIATFGFRGEALASITYVSRVTITSKVDNATVGYKCAYNDGKPKAAPQPLAMNRGTTICVEELFYNVPQRRKAFRSNADEFRRCEAVIANYSVHFPKIAFSLCKQGDNSFAINTRMGSSSLDNIRAIYGAEISRDMLPLTFEDETINVKITGYVTKANYSNKRRTQLILFINNRLVESSSIKSSIDTVYQRYLKKDDHPFVYLSLDLPASNVDVNVHPTKREVVFLHQEYILTKLQEEIDKALFSTDSSRHYLMKQPILSSSFDTSVLTKRLEDDGSESTSSGSRNDKEVIRVDSSQEKITTLFRSRENTTTQNEKVEIILTSVTELKDEIRNGQDKELSQSLGRMMYVGYVSSDKSLIQIDTQLIMVNHRRLATAFFYQCCLESFGNFAAIEFSPLPMAKALQLSLTSVESGYTADVGSRDELVEHVCMLLTEQSEMLSCYFSVNLADKSLCRLPVVLEGLLPRLGRVPLFLLRLASDVDWTDEKECFESVCKIISLLYAESCDAESLRDIVFPAMVRRKIKLSASFRSCVVKLTSTEELYKVFERC